MVQIKCLSNGLYSLKNSHILCRGFPMGNAEILLRKFDRGFPYMEDFLCQQVSATNLVHATLSFLLFFKSDAGSTLIKPGQPPAK